MTAQGCPNNNFCFTEEDFIAHYNKMNDATRYQGKNNDAWKEIKSLEGTTVPCNSSKDGRIIWYVVPSESVIDDDFKGNLTSP